MWATNWLQYHSVLLQHRLLQLKIYPALLKVTNSPFPSCDLSMSRRRCTKLPEDLARLTRSARSLRLWGRSWIQENVEHTLEGTIQRFTKGEYEQRRAQREGVLVKVTQQHDNLDSFFNTLRMPLSNKHSMVREWRQSTNRLSQAVSRLRRRTTKLNDEKLF